MTEPQQFETRGCVLVKGMFDAELITLVSKYLENKIRRGEWIQFQDGKPRSSRFGYYADPLIEVLLQDTKEKIERVTGIELLPTYSYTRVYQPGEQLKAHVDREACEVSVTVNVASVGDMSPIYTKYEDQEPEEHRLSPGDAVVYKGCAALHWRHPMKENQLQVQFMLHYVNKNGPSAKHDKDRRLAYGFPPNKGVA